MKAIIISQPKSGTYLVANILQNLGMNFTHHHLTEVSYDDYSKGVGNEKLKPENYTKKIRSPLKDTLKLISDNGFSVGHLSPNKNTINQLSDIKKVIVTRNKKDRKKSWDDFQKMRSSLDHTYKPHSFKPGMDIINWLKVENTFNINFEDIIETNIEKINELQMFLFGEIKYDSYIVIEKSLHQESLTKSDKR